MRSSLKRFLHDDSAATAIEYSLIIGVIGVVVLLGASALGSQTADLWNDNANQVTEAMKNNN